MIIAPDIRFEGFSARDWTRLVSFFGRSASPPLLVVVDDDERILNAHLLGVGLVDTNDVRELDAVGSEGTDETDDGGARPGDGQSARQRGARPDIEVSADADEGDLTGARSSRSSLLPESIDAEAQRRLHTLRKRTGASIAVSIREGTLEDLAERLAATLAEQDAFDVDFVAQWLVLLRIANEARREGRLRTSPRLPRSTPMPGYTAVRAAAQLLLPGGHSVLVATFEAGALHTAIAVERRRRGIERVVGAEQIRRWAGPLSGDHFRDQRVLREAVERHLAPVHLGVFSEADTLRELIRNPDPGAWVTAAATRDVVIQPAPAYVGVALAADGVRSLARASSDLLGGLDVFSLFRPVARTLREQLPAQAASVTGLLGFNPLQALARFLQGDHGEEDSGGRDAAAADDDADDDAASNKT